MPGARVATEVAARRAVAPVLVAVAVAVVLTSCATGSTTASPAATTTPVATGPATTGTLAAVLRATTATSGRSAAFTMTFRHPADSLSVLPLAARGAVDFRAPAATIAIELPRSSGGTERMVFRPGTVFFRPPPSSPPLRPGRPWIFANFADIAKYRVNFPPYIVQTESINPAFTVDEVAWGAVRAAPAGTTTLDGEQVRTFVVTVDLPHALARSAGPDGAVFARTLASEIAASGSSDPTVPVVVWVDRSGVLVGAQTAPVGAGIGTLTLQLGRFGVEVRADKPPRSTVVDLAEIIPGAERAALNGGDADGA